MQRELATHMIAGASSRLSLPEYRQIELYAKRKTLTFASDAPASELPLPNIAGACRAFMALDAILAPSAEGLTTWQRYLSLPRACLAGKVTAELYRVLRVLRLLTFHPHGHAEIEDGIVKFNGAVNKVALTLDITAAGVVLLELAVAYYLDSLRQPYPQAYIEAVLVRYFTDIVAEIKRFADEDCNLYQFRPKYAFNRHFRFDCDNPKTQTEDGFLKIETTPTHRDAALYPIDFYVTANDALHIVPAEALRDGKLPLAELGRWRARVPESGALPSDFRLRFARETQAPNQPMT